MSRNAHGRDESTLSRIANGRDENAAFRIARLLLWPMLVLFALSASSANPRIDILLRGGLVVDGSGAAAFRGDIAIDDGRILRVSKRPITDVRADLLLDIEGKIVAPGFIDPHTHARADLLSVERAGMINYLTQGVTTVVIGNDGDGTHHIRERFDAMRDNGIGTHVAQFVGHGALRRAVVGNVDVELDEDEMQQMQSLLRDAMEQGALGLSTGLFYTPGSFASTDEVVALAEIIAEYDGVYDSHIRSESSRGDGVLAAVAEAIEIGKRSGARAHIAHIKVLGRDVWGESKAVIAMIEKARAAGVRITADQYPWPASSTQLKNAVLSKDWLTGSREAWQGRLNDPDNEAAVLLDLTRNIDRRGGPESLVLVATQEGRFDNMHLGDVAEAMQTSPERAALALLRVETPRVISYNMREADITAFMAQPWVVTSSDGTDGHPRKYASFPRKYAHYVREQGIMSTEQFVRRSAAVTADILGLAGRGYLREGYHADVVVFDAEAFSEGATFQAWNVLSRGMEHVFVNGQAAILNGQFRDIRPGEGLRPARHPWAPEDEP